MRQTIGAMIGCPVPVPNPMIRIYTQICARLHRDSAAPFGVWSLRAWRGTHAASFTLRRGARTNAEGNGLIGRGCGAGWRWWARARARTRHRRGRA
eukprot:6862908-Prymnesium_polylepis.1